MINRILAEIKNNHDALSKSISHYIGCGTGGNGWATGGSDCSKDTDVNVL